MGYREDRRLLEAGKISVAAHYVGVCHAECSGAWRRTSLHVRKASLRDHRAGSFRRRKGWRLPAWRVQPFVPYDEKRYSDRWDLVERRRLWDAGYSRDEIFHIRSRFKL